MDWISGIQKALNYIEKHMEEELDYADIASQAACSNYYFQRIFGILCGISLGEYIRNRRLTLAGSELSKANRKVVDVALKYGYESPESFTRAFVKFHGITPSEAKRDGSKLKSYSPLSVQIILKGGHLMDYKIMEKPAFQVIEKVEKHSISDSQQLNTIPEFWGRAHRDGTVAKLLSITSARNYIFGICYGGDLTDEKTFDYGIGAEYDGNAEVPEGYRVNEIPARTWAVFEVRGAMPEAIQQLWHNICAEFFPASEYQPTYEMDIEVYPAGDMTAPDYHSEIWVPVVKK
ncbi:MAG: AraC family transcriptional regulator [Eubacteriales bacterium]|nr:AraC family transcriptional regulator [Eubacteriales bacterium]